MAVDTFDALLIREVAEGGDSTQAAIEALPLTALPDLPVEVAVRYSSLNYKDGLAITGRGRICRRLPMVAGIDLAGEVLSSEDARYAPGDWVIANGYGLSETLWGGYSQRQRLDGDHLLPLDKAFSGEQAMAIGTAGYTAMLSILAICDHGVTVDSGDVLVTGAAGGVGSMAVMLLAAMGYRVVASTGRVDECGDFLLALGASEIFDRREFDCDSKPLSSPRWAAVVDVVGGRPLATILSQLQYGGIVSACGLASSMSLPASVAPFILRGVTLRGIDSVMASRGQRLRAWEALAKWVNPEQLTRLYAVHPMTDLPKLAEQIVAGEIRGRLVIDTAV